MKRSRKQRRAENDAAAASARFWIGKIKSADRLLYSQPVNRQAAKVIQPRKDR